MIPVSGSLPQMAAQHDRSIYLYITGFSVDFSPIVKQCIFEHHAVWQEEREARSLFSHHEQSQLFSKFPVITLLRLFDHGQILFKLCFLRECSSVDSLEHLVVLIASPVCSGQTCQLKRLHRLCCHKMRACAQVSKFSL